MSTKSAEPDKSGHSPLLPCPCCGSSASAIRNEARWFIECDTCGLNTPSDNFADPEKCWNTRATLGQRIAEIRERLRGATAGPWTFEQEFICCGGYDEGVSIAKIDSDPLAGKDGEFIAHSREDIPYLLSVIDAAPEASGTAEIEKALAELRELFPTAITVEAREDRHARYFADYPDNKTHAYSYGLISVGFSGLDVKEWRENSLEIAMAKVREFARKESEKHGTSD